MRKLKGVLCILLVCLPFSLLGQDAIERVEVEGNERIPDRTILHYFGTRSGFLYDKEAIEEGVQALWDSHFFSDIEVGVKKGETGLVIVLSIEEYPIVEKVVFETGEKIKEEDILEKLEEKNIGLKPYSLYDPQKMLEIRQTIEGMLAEEGFGQGAVSLETREVGRFEVEAIFHIREGPRYKIGEITFEGDPKLSRKTLLGAFQNNKVHNFFSWLKGEDIYRKAKLEEDLENLRRTYRDYGYLEARIGEPVVEEFTRKAVFGGPVRMKKIIVPVEAGHRYYLDDISLEGNDPAFSPQICRYVLLKKGEIFDEDKKVQSAEKIKRFYQNRGYLFVEILTYEYLDTDNKKVDVTFDIREGEVVHMRRLHIKGNTFTRDPVVRREILIPEQERLRLNLFEESLKKLARLGVARIEEPPEMKPDQKEPAQMDVYLDLVDRYSNEWQLTGGYSGYQGLYFGGKFSLADFLGKGEIIDLLLEYGQRTKNYVFGLSKPYLFDRLICLRSKVYDRDIVYTGLFERRGKGAQVGLDLKIKGYWWAGVEYDFERVGVGTAGIEIGEIITDENISSLSAFLSRDTVDNLFFPSNGSRCWISVDLADSFLGSEIQYLKTQAEGAVFFPFLKNYVLGLHLEYRNIHPIGKSIVPRWEKFYLGGESSIRGYAVYSIGHRSSERQNVGGDKSLVFNVEYIVPIFETVRAIFFLDGGNAIRLSDHFALNELYWSSGLEVRLRLRSIPIPLRLIFAYNNRLIEPEDSHFALRIAFSAYF